MEEVRLSPLNYERSDEIYGELYKCDNCKNVCIFTHYNFCPECGVKINSTFTDLQDILEDLKYFDSIYNMLLKSSTPFSLLSCCYKINKLLNYSINYANSILEREK